MFMPDGHALLTLVRNDYSADTRSDTPSKNVFFAKKEFKDEEFSSSGTSSGKD